MPPEDSDSSKDPFGGLLAVPRERVFKALSIGNTKGHELIKDGTFEVLDLGPRCKPITVESVHRLLRNGGTKVA